MDGHIDWLSYTVPCRSEPRTADQVFYIAKGMTERICPDVSKIYFTGADVKPGAGRAPYRYQMVAAGSGFRCFGGGANNTLLTEITGRGCDVLRDEALARRIVSQLGGRLTRLDYAVDVCTDVSVGEFTSQRSNNRFTAISNIQSRSGETSYVGSPRSDRFCRIYRYAYPHPRHKLLRAEFVFRRKLAKCAAQDYAAEETRLAFANRCANTFGLDFGGFNPAIENDTKLSTPERSEHEGKTVSWLYSQVAPAVKRCLDQDALNLTDWLEHIYSL